jgi:hypothetical protein
VEKSQIRDSSVLTSWGASEQDSEWVHRSIPEASQIRDFNVDESSE